MLTRLSFKRFKSWQDSGDIRLAPITVFFGSNSAGKTSIPQLLLLLKQTAESSDRQRVLQLGDANRTLVDLGTFEDLMYEHDMAASFDFELEWTLGDRLRIEDAVSNRSYAGDKLNFSASIGADRNQQPVVRSLAYRLLDGQDRILGVAMQRAASGKFELSADDYRLVRHQGRPWPLPDPIRFYGFPDEAAVHFQNAAFVSDLAFQLERLLKSIYYVGPLRKYPKRLYLWSGEVPDHVGTRGDRAIEAILAASKRNFNWIAKQKTKPLAALVAERLRGMGLIDDFKIRPLGANRKEYEVLVRTRARLPEVKLTDVGFGVSQVLPVIVEAFFVPRHSIVIFEQPEIHLHPRVQAALADLFVDAVRAREAGQARDCQFIIESHSEHFLRRLQRRIAEEQISSDQVALYFVDVSDVGSTIRPLAVDLFGNIANWPDGFFGDEMEDLVARAEAQAKRSGAVGD